MVKDAEINKAKDEQAKKMIEERNGLEQTAYQMKAQLSNDQMKDKFTDEDKKVISDACDKTLRFLDGEPNATIDELKQKKEELNKIVHPIMQKIYA